MLMSVLVNPVKMEQFAMTWSTGQFTLLSTLTIKDLKGYLSIYSYSSAVITKVSVFPAISLSAEMIS